MRHLILKFGMAALLGSALLSPTGFAKTAKPSKKTPAKSAAPKWLTSHKQALALAKKTGKPILINFGAVWCGPCHMMEDEVFKKASFAPEGKKWVLLKIDMDKHPDLASHYNAQILPTLVALTPKGRPASLQRGYPMYKGYNQIMIWIKRAYKKAKK
jgi:protein disulfide-isomerase